MQVDPVLLPRDRRDARLAQHRRAQHGGPVRRRVDCEQLHRAGQHRGRGDVLDDVQVPQRQIR